MNPIHDATEPDDQFNDTENTRPTPSRRLTRGYFIPPSSWRAPDTSGYDRAQRVRRP